MPPIILLSFQGFGTGVCLWNLLRLRRFSCWSRTSSFQSLNEIYSNLLLHGSVHTSPFKQMSLKLVEHLSMNQKTVSEGASYFKFKARFQVILGRFPETTFWGGLSISHDFGRGPVTSWWISYMYVISIQSICGPPKSHKIFKQELCDSMGIEKVEEISRSSQNW